MKAFTITIGEASLYWTKSRCAVDATIVNRDDSPRLDGPTDGTNTLWPSVESWRQFVHAVELESLMDSLMPQHPGAAPITAEHADFAAMKLARYQAKYLTHPAHLQRAEWLAYWLAWAVTNCHQPVFVNH